MRIRRRILRAVPSMGPRLCSRGDRRRRPSHLPFPIGLQWGRGFVAAETNPMPSYGRRGWRLQWGRGFVAAETRDAECTLWIGRHGLQWGRGFVAAETGGGEGGKVTARSFNGAAAL